MHDSKLLVTAISVFGAICSFLAVIGIPPDPKSQLETAHAARLEAEALRDVTRDRLEIIRSAKELAHSTWLTEHDKAQRASDELQANKILHAANEAAAKEAADELKTQESLRRQDEARARAARDRLASKRVDVLKQQVKTLTVSLAEERKRLGQAQMEQEGFGKEFERLWREYNQLNQRLRPIEIHLANARAQEQKRLDLEQKKETLENRLERDYRLLQSNVDAMSWEMLGEYERLIIQYRDVSRSVEENRETAIAACETAKHLTAAIRKIKASGSVAKRGVASTAGNVVKLEGSVIRIEDQIARLSLELRN